MPVTRRASAARALALVGGLGACAGLAWSAVQPFPTLSGYATVAQVQALQAAMPALAPVQSVNGATGAVAVPVYQRQVSPALAPGSDGTLTWTFPTAFGNTPTCWPSLAATSTNYTFDYPEQTAISRTSVSYLVTAHPRSLTIATLTLPIVLQLTPPAPPGGTTLTLSCIAPM